MESQKDSSNSNTSKFPNFFKLGISILTYIAYIEVTLAQDCKDKLSSSYPVTDTKRYDGKCYAFVDREVFWHTASDVCDNAGGKLIEIDNEKTQRLIQSKLNRMISWDNDGIWIGARKTGNGWEWSSGNDVQYTNWADGWPLGIAGTCKGDCALLRKSEDYKWTDCFCRLAPWKYNFICQFGEPLTYTNWAQGWPGGFWPCTGDCALMRRKYFFKWTDCMCKFFPWHYKFICEFEDDEDDDEVGSTGVGVGIGVSVAIVLLIILGCAVFCCYRRKKQLEREERAHTGHTLTYSDVMRSEEEGPMGENRENTTNIQLEKVPLKTTETEAPPKYEEVFPEGMPLNSSQGGASAAAAPSGSHDPAPDYEAAAATPYPLNPGKTAETESPLEEKPAKV